MRVVVVVAFLALVAVASSSNSTFGSIGPFDLLLHHSIRRKSSSFMKIVTENVKFPLAFQQNNRTITGIRIIDQLPKSKAYAQIYAGGIGYNHTLVHFKSERGKGFNFSFEIYGRP